MCQVQTNRVYLPDGISHPELSKGALSNDDGVVQDRVGRHARITHEMDDVVVEIDPRTSLSLVLSVEIDAIAVPNPGVKPRSSFMGSGKVSPSRPGLLLAFRKDKVEFSKI